MPPLIVPSGNQGIINKPSNHSVDQTVEKLKKILQSKGVTLLRWWTTAEKQKEWE